MLSRHGALSATLAACAPLPALIIGIAAMRQLHVHRLAPATNIAAAVLGLLVWAWGRRLSPPTRRQTQTWLTVASIAAVLLPFASEGVLGVYRWVAVAGLRLHAAMIVAPLIILCVAAAASRGMRTAVLLGVTCTIIVALQPDAAQTTSLAAGCVVVLVYTGRKQTRSVSLGVALLLCTSAVSFVRQDPLAPVAHVEGIFGFVASRGPGPAAMATVALLLLPAPFFVVWRRHRRPATLALGIYVTMTIAAPAWGTFPVPVMGYGASPILGYFIALCVGVGRASQIGPSPPIRLRRMLLTTDRNGSTPVPQPRPSTASNAPLSGPANGSR